MEEKNLNNEKQVIENTYQKGMLTVTHATTKRDGIDKDGKHLEDVHHFTTVASEEAQNAARAAYKDGKGTFEEVAAALGLKYCQSGKDGNPNGTPCVNLGDSKKEYWRNLHDILNACNITILKRTKNETTTRNNKRRGKEKQTITNVSRLDWLVDLFTENVQRYFGCYIDNIKERLSDVYHVAKERDIIEAFRNFDAEQARKQAQTSAEELKKLQQVALMLNKSVDEVAEFKFGLSPDEAIKYVDELELKAAPALQ